MDVEVVRLDGKRLLELEFVGGVAHNEVEPLQNGDHCELDFLPRKRATLQSILE